MYGCISKCGVPASILENDCRTSGVFLGRLNYGICTKYKKAHGDKVGHVVHIVVNNDPARSSSCEWDI